MTRIVTFITSRSALVLLSGALAFGMAWPRDSTGQNVVPAISQQQKTDESASTDKDLAAQLHHMQAKLTRLEAALKQGHKAMPSGAPDAGGAGRMPMGPMANQKMGMGMMADDMQEMMGMGNMGQGGTSMPSGAPGFPGASHIYHIGATGFFLDHPEHIKLTTKQQTDLNSLKETALLEKSSSQRRIEEVEQELWTLTASDKPDAGKIDAKVREIEKLRGDQRLAFIRAVGEAAKVLTDEQRQALLGYHADKPSAHSGH